MNTTELHVLDIAIPMVAMGTSAVSFCCLHRPETFSADTTPHSTATQTACSSEHVLTFFFSLRTGVLNVVTVKH